MDAAHDDDDDDDDAARHIDNTAFRDADKCFLFSVVLDLHDQSVKDS